MKTTSSRNWTTAGAKESKLSAHFSAQALKASDTRPGARSLFALLPLTSPSRESGLAPTVHFTSSYRPRLRNLASLFSVKFMLVFSPVFAFLIALLLNLTITTLFPDSAYAETYINLSSSGKVAFGKVLPSSVGTLTTGQDTLNVGTNCAEGVSIYATSVNGGSTSMVNEAMAILDTSGTNESTYTISTSTNTVGSGSATALANNTWGLNTNAEEAGNNLYYGLPAYSASSLPAAIYTGALPAGTGGAYTGTIPVYYGAKVTSLLSAGTYTGKVLYTAMVNAECLKYTVSFNANGGTGTMNSQKIIPATATNLSTNTFTRENYTFLGWSTSATGKTGTAVDGVGTSADVDYADGASVIDLTTAGGDITLYAIWELNTHTVTISSGTGISSTTGSGTYVTGQTVTISATPTSGYKFSSWTVNSGGASLASTTSSSTSFTMPDANVTITANGVSATPTCSASVHPTTSTGCKMADNKTWILGNNGGTAAWTALFTNATGQNNHDATLVSGKCPSGYSAAKLSDYQALLSAQGTGSQLYTALGLSGYRNFWSSTEDYSSIAYRLVVDSSGATTGIRDKGNSYYLLCVK
ncbi:InlB B-repeat-containing protein [Candidatus Saccharibacteria bacterium]|nr:InlB B-repeat-containing protein [Candidatus Saccharibacteria bacterium]